MKFASSLVSFVTLAATLASARPLSRRNALYGARAAVAVETVSVSTPAVVSVSNVPAAVESVAVQCSPAAAVAAVTQVGAAYWISNEPSGNMIITTSIASDGTLAFANAVSTGGRGLHGITTPAGAPDGLFSQGAIKVGAAGKLLATVNPGSDTIAMFSINPQDPTKITMVGNPVSSEGEWPMSLAVSSDSKSVCVLNGGQVNGVNCFTMDPVLGLIQKPNTLRLMGLNVTTPAAGPAGTASHIIFSEDGTKLIASVKGVPPTPGFLATWDVLSDGSLSQTFTKSTPAAGGLLPFSMTAIPGKNAVLATDAGVGFSIFDFANGNSATSTIVPIAGQGATCWSSFSQQTGNFYLTDIDTSIVTEVNVNSNLVGSIVKQYPMPAGSATIDNDVVTIGKSDFMFVLSPNTTSVEVLSLNAPGAATHIQTFNMAADSLKAGVTISTANLQGMTAFITPV